MIELSSAQPTEPITLHWILPPSKSLMARRLVLSALRGEELPSLEALSLEDTPEDIRALLQALQKSREGSAEINVGESGTAMRFMTAYLSVAANVPCRLEGTARQQDRPIAPLVDALRSLGADIQYMGKEGLPSTTYHTTHTTLYRGITRCLSKLSVSKCPLPISSTVRGTSRYSSL